MILKMSGEHQVYKIAHQLILYTGTSEMCKDEPSISLVELKKELKAEEVPLKAPFP